MKSFLFASMIMFCVLMAGCAILDKVAPMPTDSQGNVISVMREPTEVTKAVAGAIPYGDLALNVVLFLAYGVESFKRRKVEKGLVATLKAGKDIANDPEMKEAWDKIKVVYKQEHENAHVAPLIKLMLAKLPSSIKG